MDYIMVWQANENWSKTTLKQLGSLNTTYLHLPFTIYTIH